MFLYLILVKHFSTSSSLISYLALEETAIGSKNCFFIPLPFVFCRLSFPVTELHNYNITLVCICLNKLHFADFKPLSRGSRYMYLLLEYLSVQCRVKFDSVLHCLGPESSLNQHAVLQCCMFVSQICCYLWLLFTLAG